MTIEAMKQALEALDIYGAHAGMCDQLVLLTSNPPIRKPCSCGLHKAITALRQAIAEAEKQINALKGQAWHEGKCPVCGTVDPAETEKQDSNPIKDGWQLSVADGHSGYGVYAHMDEYPEEGAILLMPIAEKQEPVDGVVLREGLPTLLRKSDMKPTDQRLYTHPPKREWVGLRWSDTPDEWLGNVSFMEGAKWAEAKLKEKNFT